MRTQSILVLALMLLAAVATGAQTITGTVVDRDGAAISGAEISITQDATTFSRMTTGVSGEFTLDAGGRSDARLRVTARGFEIFEQPIGDVVSPIRIVLQPPDLFADVTISITKTETRLGETPASVVVLDRDELDSTAAQTIDDSLRQIAGFTLFRRSSSKTSNPTTQGANLRGVGGSGAARTTVQFDGVSLNDAFGGWTFWSRVPGVAVERVEVLRGGASSLYGTAGLSGAIDLRSASDRGNAFRIEGSSGSQGTFEGGSFAALNHAGWYANVAAESFQTVGYIPVDPGERGSIDTRTNSRHNSGFLTLERDLGKSSRVFGRASLFAERRDNGTSLTNNRTYFRQATLGGDTSGERLGLFQFRATVDGQVYDQTFSAVAPDRNSENLTRVQRVPSRSVAASAFWTRSFRDHAVSAQTDFRYVRGFSEEVAVSNGVATAFVTSGGKETAVGLFAQDFWRVTPRLSFNLSIRYDRWREFGGLSRTRSVATGQTVETIFDARADQSFSPRVGAIYGLTRAVSIYGSYSRSFRTPSLNELYRSFRVGNVLTLANETLRAERAATIEGGVIATLFSRRATLRTNVFQTNVDDPVVSVTLSSTPTLITRRRENVGETRTRGVETDAEFLATDRLRLNFGYLFVDSRVVDAGASPAPVDKRLPQVARQQFTTRVSYRPMERITLSFQARASDAQFDDDLNTFRLRPFFAIDLYAAYRFRKWVEPFAAVENALDSRYDIGLTPVQTIAGPRYLRAGFRFDLNRKD
jgi:outer membrane receptor protein involved in Fe transport